jgi:hypothetical protein
MATFQYLTLANGAAVYKPGADVGLLIRAYMNNTVNNEVGAPARLRLLLACLQALEVDIDLEWRIRI